MSAAARTVTRWRSTRSATPPTRRSSRRSRRLAGTYQGDRRWRIEHAQISTPPTCRALPGRHHRLDAADPPDQRPDDGRGADRAGAARRRLCVADARESGARLAFGSDFPVEIAQPLPRPRRRDQPPGSQRPAAGRLAAARARQLRAALAGFTRGAAYAGFAEGRIGSLDPGGQADFILVDRDISTSTPSDLAATQVVETWVAGRKVWQRAA